MFDLMSAIMDFEDGSLTEEDTIILFQRLINNGMAWTLQGFYGRTAVQLINADLCHR